MFHSADNSLVTAQKKLGKARRFSHTKSASCLKSAQPTATEAAT